MTKVISFFTEDWKYPEYAENLKQDCEKLGLEYRIEHRKNTGSYSKNTAIKPFYIKECLMSEQEPLLWIDVDASILKYPSVVDTFVNKYDIAVKKRVNQDHDLAWHVGTIWLNNNDATKEFVDFWSRAGASTDDRSFDLAYRRYADSIRIVDLPAEYFFIHTRHVAEIPRDTVIMHRISNGEQKLNEKYKKT
jgi:hypothetical protein